MPASETTGRSRGDGTATISSARARDEITAALARVLAPDSP
jgi:hypothetical protein